MANVNKGASLAPEDHAGGGQIPDGEYLITNVYAGLFTYNGTVPEGVPVIMVTYKSDDGAEYEQPYKAGDNEHLKASDDGERFIHPGGEEARIYKGGAASQWLSSMARANFKIEGDSVRQFKGTKVVLANVAAPKGRGNDNKEGKVFPLVTKILKMPTETKTSAPKGTSSASKTTAPAPASAPANGNADLTASTIELIQGILAEAPDNTISRMKLSTQVMLKATKDANLKLNMTAFKKLAGDPTFLMEHAEVGGWTTENGEEIRLG